MKSFEEVARLDEAALRALLRGDSSTHRVWAAWALGLRDGRAMEEEARRRIRHEPSPGVRRSLAVMLARDADAMRVLALDDPNEFVRVTAWRLNAQVATPDAQLAGRLIAAAQNDASDEVAKACLQLLLPLAPMVATEDVLTCLARSDVTVRDAAIDLLFTKNEIDALVAWVLGCAEAEFARVGQRLCTSGHAPRLLIAAQRTALAASSLRCLLWSLQYDVDMTFEALAWLATREDVDGPEFILDHHPAPTFASLAFFVSLATQGAQALAHSREFPYVSERAFVALERYGEENAGAGLHLRWEIEALLRILEDPKLQDSVLQQAVPSDISPDGWQLSCEPLRVALRRLIQQA